MAGSPAAEQSDLRIECKQTAGAHGNSSTGLTPLSPATTDNWPAKVFDYLAGDEAIARHKQHLFDRLAEQALTPQGEAVMAFYNPPWTLPFLRRNEILVKIQSVE